MMQLKFQCHKGFYVRADKKLREELGRDNVIKAFELKAKKEIEEFNDLLSKEKEIIEKRTKILDMLKSNFQEFIIEEMPEVLL